MPVFIEGEIQEVWNTYKYGSADDFYQTQFNSLLQQCANKDTLPFFEIEKKEPPYNMLNRNIMRDINKITAELHAASIGAKENTYIFGREANDLGLQLDSKKNITPLLVAAQGKYNNSRQILLNELNVADSGAEVRHQFMYNIEQFDERSQKILREITSPERQKYIENEKIREAESKQFYKENLTNQENKKMVNEILATNQNVAKKLNLSMVSNATLIHQIAQSQKTHELIGTKHIAPDIIEKKKEAFKNEVFAVRKAMEDGKAPEDALMKAIFNSQMSAEKIVSKDVGYERDHQKFEHIKKKENLRVIDRGIER